MAVWNEKCGGFIIKIHNRDHPPAHCHVLQTGFSMVVDLWTLTVLKPKGAPMPPKVRKCLKEYREAMLKVWDNEVEVREI